MLELYHSGLTTCSKQVRHCLREKGLKYESKYVELWRYENLSPDYLKLNPNGVVPTLVHDGTPVINSFCINEYIEDAFPEPPLRPADATERARMRYWAWTADEIHLQLARLTHARLLHARVKDLSAQDHEIMLKSTPVPEKRDRWRVLTQGGYSDEQLATALDNVLFVFGRMEKELSERGPWLAGQTFSLGDISMLAIVHRIFELYPDRLDRRRFRASTTGGTARCSGPPRSTPIPTAPTRCRRARRPSRSPELRSTGCELNGRYRLLRGPGRRGGAVRIAASSIGRDGRRPDIERRATLVGAVVRSSGPVGRSGRSVRPIRKAGRQARSHRWREPPVPAIALSSIDRSCWTA